MSLLSENQTGLHHLRKMMLALLAYSAFIAPAAAQSVSQTDDDGANTYSSSSSSFLRGTTSNGTGRQDDTSRYSSVPYPERRQQAASSGSSPDPFVQSYATTVAPEDDSDNPQGESPGTDSARSDETGRQNSVDATEAENNQYGRLNTPAATLDGLQTGTTPEENEVPGFRIGTMTLRPTLTQKVVHESNKSGGSTDNRTYSETTLETVLESDWSRHKLTIDGAATFEKNISGTGQEEPQVDLNATVDIDISENMSAQFRAGYGFSKEDRTDPNAIVNATAQAGVHSFTSAVSLTKSLGHLRGTATAEFGRTIYGNATLSGGTVISGRDRDNTSYGLRTRVGYEVSPALIPFVEASVNRANYDIKTDTSGFQRSSTTYGLRVGAELPIGDKISGELSAGYLRRIIDDPALSTIGAFSLDGSLIWSPMRGTTLSATASTALESSTTAGQSGSVVHQLTVGVEHQLRAAVVARLTGTVARRNFQGSTAIADQTTLDLSGELDWSVNRYLSVITEAGFERTSQPGTSASNTARVGLGLRLRR